MIRTDFIGGLVPPMLTPCNPDQTINIKKLRFMVDHVIEGGVHGILVYGSNSEFFAIEEEEMKRGLDAILDQNNKRVPIFMGIGAINTKVCIRMAKWAVEMGVDGISVLQPMFVKPNEEELYKHFKAIADAVPETPMLIYNNPGRTGYGLSVKLISKLGHEVENIVGTKDSSGDLSLTSELLRLTKDIDFKVFCGKDTLIFPALALGCAGAVPCMCNFAAPLVREIWDKFQAGDYEGARDAQFRMNPLRLSMDAASFPTGTKDMANLMGLEVGSPFLPNMDTKGVAFETMKELLAIAGYSVKNIQR